MADRYYLIDKGFGDAPAYVLAETPNREWADREVPSNSQIVLSREEALGGKYRPAIEAWEAGDDSAFVETESRWEVWAAGYDEITRHVLVDQGGDGHDLGEALKAWGIGGKNPPGDPMTDDFEDFSAFTDAASQPIREMLYSLYGRAASLNPEWADRFQAWATGEFGQVRVAVPGSPPEGT